MERKTWEARRRRLGAIIEVGNDGDFVSRTYDIVNTLAIVANLTASILRTFDAVEAQCGGVLNMVEVVTYLFLRWITVCAFGQPDTRIRVPRSCGRYAAMYFLPRV